MCIHTHLRQFMKGKGFALSVELTNAEVSPSAGWLRNLSLPQLVAYSR